RRLGARWWWRCRRSSGPPSIVGGYKSGRFRGSWNRFQNNETERSRFAPDAAGRRSGGRWRFASSDDPRRAHVAQERRRAESDDGGREVRLALEEHLGEQGDAAEEEAEDACAGKDEWPRTKCLIFEHAGCV